MYLCNYLLGISNNPFKYKLQDTSTNHVMNLGIDCHKTVMQRDSNK